MTNSHTQPDSVDSAGPAVCTPRIGPRDCGPAPDGISVTEWTVLDRCCVCAALVERTMSPAEFSAWFGAPKDRPVMCTVCASHSALEDFGGSCAIAPALPTR